jgi:hypothetical protein
MDSPVREHFRHTLRRRREEMDILQRDIARRFGVTRIAKTLGLTLEERVGEPVRRPTQEVPILDEIHAGKSGDRRRRRPLPRQPLPQRLPDSGSQATEGLGRCAGGHGKAVRNENRLCIHFTYVT